MCNSPLYFTQRAATVIEAKRTDIDTLKTIVIICTNCSGGPWAWGRDANANPADWLRVVGCT